MKSAARLAANAQRSARVREPHLASRQLDELVEDSHFPGVVATMTSPTVRSLLEQSELVAERANRCAMLVRVRPPDGFADLAFQPRIELTVRDQLRLPIMVGGGAFPASRDAHDLRQVPVCVETGVVPIVPDTRAHRLSASRTAIRGDLDCQPSATVPCVLRTGLSYGSQRQCKESEVQ